MNPDGSYAEGSFGAGGMRVTITHTATLYSRNLTALRLPRDQDLNNATFPTGFSIRTLEPLLKNAEAGRAVFVSSGAASGKYAYWGPYAASKAGLEALAKTWAQELADTPVRVNVVNPGATRTTMRAKAFPGEDPLKLPTPEDLVPLFLDLVLPSCARTGDVINFRDWRTVAQAMPGSGAAIANADV